MIIEIEKTKREDGEWTKSGQIRMERDGMRERERAKVRVKVPKMDEQWCANRWTERWRKTQGKDENKSNKFEIVEKKRNNFLKHCLINRSISIFHLINQLGQPTTANLASVARNDLIRNIKLQWMFVWNQQQTTFFLENLSPIAKLIGFRWEMATERRKKSSFCNWMLFRKRKIFTLRSNENISQLYSFQKPVFYPLSGSPFSVSKKTKLVKCNESWNSELIRKKVSALCWSTLRRLQSDAGSELDWQSLLSLPGP